MSSPPRIRGTRSRSSSTVEQAAVKDLGAVTRRVFLNLIAPVPRPPVPFLTAVGTAGRRFFAFPFQPLDLAFAICETGFSAQVAKEVRCE